jgi:excinuclease UvrABC nuclease subunit
VTGNCPGVYFLFDGEELVYIGKSWNCFLRVAEHTRKETDKVFTSWSFVPTEYDESLLELEKQLIKEHRPKYNVQHNST